MSYYDRDRLDSAVRAITARFGGGVLVDVQRTRNLLLDEYGSSTSVQRADVEQFTQALRAGADDMWTVATPSTVAVAGLAARTSLSAEDAAFTVTLVRSVTAPTAAPSWGAPAPAVSPVDEPAMTVLGASAPLARERSTLVKVLAATTVVATLAAVVILVVSVGKIHDWESKAKAAQQGSVVPGGGSDKTNETITRLNEAVTAKDAQIASLTDDVTAKAADIASLTDDVTGKAADIASVTDDVTRLKMPFSIVAKDVAPLLNTTFTGELANSACTGLSDTCSPTYYIDALIVDEGGQLFLDIDYTAKIPIGTFDGVGWVGQAPVPVDNGFLCDKAPWATTATVSLTPARYRIDRDRETVAWEALRIVLTLTAPQTACPAGIETFEGEIAVP